MGLGDAVYAAYVRIALDATARARDAIEGASVRYGMPDYCEQQLRKALDAVKCLQEHRKQFMLEEEKCEQAHLDARAKS